MKAQLKSRCPFSSPIFGDIVSACNPDTGVVRWVEEGTPLRINRKIESKKGSSHRPKRRPNRRPWRTRRCKWRGATLSTILQSWRTRRTRRWRWKDLSNWVFSRGSPSKWWKERADKSKKRRLIIDVRRSGGNSKAKLNEKLVLPRALDAVTSMKTMVRLKGSVAEQRELLKREMVLIDASDVFPHLAVHYQELEHCLTPGLQQDEFFLFRALLFGYKTAPFLTLEQGGRLAGMGAASMRPVVRRTLSSLSRRFLAMWLLQGTLQRRMKSRDSSSTRWGLWDSTFP